MSYITLMSVNEGIVMAADRQGMFRDKNGQLKVATKTSKKITATGNNIAINHGGVGHKDADLYFGHLAHTKTFNSPIEAALEIKGFFANNVQQANSEIAPSGYSTHTEIFIAGYDKRKLEKPPQMGTFNKPMPEIYFLNTQDGKITDLRNYGFWCRGANQYFDRYQEKINVNIHSYTLQDAIDITRFAFDTSRGLGRYLDKEDLISDDMEIIAITPYGIEWVQKKELELIYVNEKH